MSPWRNAGPFVCTTTGTLLCTAGGTLLDEIQPPARCSIVSAAHEAALIGLCDEL